MTTIVQEFDCPVRFFPMTTAERDAIVNKPNGLVIHNTTTEQIEIWLGNEWNGIQDGHGHLVVGNNPNFALWETEGIPRILFYYSISRLGYSFLEYNGSTETLSWYDTGSPMIDIRKGADRYFHLILVPLQLTSQTTPQTPYSGMGRFYAKAVADVPHPHWLDDDGVETDMLAVDAAAATGSLRTLGTAATAACAGNDARLSDARTPTAHKTSHQDAGSDEISVAGLSGVLADSQIANKIVETAGPTTLTVGAVADGEYLKRSGATVVGGTPAGGGGGGAGLAITFALVLGGD